MSQNSVTFVFSTLQFSLIIPLKEEVNSCFLTYEYLATDYILDIHLYFFISNTQILNFIITYERKLYLLFSLPCIVSNSLKFDNACLERYNGKRKECCLSLDG